MGEIVAQHDDVKRGLEIENYAKEAVVHWNAPPPALARELCIAALKLHCSKNKSAKKRDWRTAFVHTKGRDHNSGDARKNSAFFKSQVVERHLKKKPRFGFWSS